MLPTTLEAYVVEGAALLSTTLVAYARVRLCSCRWQARRRLVIRMWPHSPVSLRYSLCAELPPRPRMRGAHPHRQGQARALRLLRARRTSLRKFESGGVPRRAAFTLPEGQWKVGRRQGIFDAAWQMGAVGPICSVTSQLRQFCRRSRCLPATNNQGTTTSHGRLYRTTTRTSGGNLHCCICTRTVRVAAPWNVK